MGKDKKIADTLLGLREDYVVQSILDKSQNIGSIVNDELDQFRTEKDKSAVKEVFDAWYDVDFTKRRPAPAYFEGDDGKPIFQGTDLDLFSFLLGLEKRKAVLNVPEYKRMRKANRKDDEIIVSREHRHGKFNYLKSNQKVHAFSINIIDFQVIKDKGSHQQVGYPRNFSVVDVFGKWHDGWKVLELRPNVKENDFFVEHGLVDSNNKIQFKYFVHPSLAYAIAGSRYLKSKILNERVKDEMVFYQSLAGTIRAKGIKRPRFYSGGNFNIELKRFKDEPKDEKLIKVTPFNLEARIWIPEFSGEYSIMGLDRDKKLIEYSKLPEDYADLQNVLTFSEIRVKELRKMNYLLDAVIRGVELAAFREGFNIYKKEYTLVIPPWFIPDFKEFKETPRSNKYQSLDFKNGIRWGYRLRKTTQDVAKKALSKSSLKELQLI